MNNLWKIVFNTNLRDWGNVQNALLIIRHSGYKLFLWDHTIYKVPPTNDDPLSIEVADYKDFFPDVE